MAGGFWRRSQIGYFINIFNIMMESWFQLATFLQWSRCCLFSATAGWRNDPQARHEREGTAMTKISTKMVQTVAPFFMGMCMAGAASSGSVVVMVALIAAAGAFGLVSFPVGGRLVARLTEATA